MATALAREHYEADKEIADVEEPPFRPAFVEVDIEAVKAAEAIALPRVSTEDLIVHILDERGFWHRLHPSTVKTACGFPINFYKSPTRSGRHADHPLATLRPDGKQCQCWTDDERGEADDTYRKKFGQDFIP